MADKPSESEQSAAPDGQGVEPPRRHTPLPGMYHALVTLQKRNIEALQIGEGRGLSTREMAEHLERESGMLDLYEALEAIVTGERGPLLLGEPEMIERMERGRLRMEKARAALGKARGESNAKRNG